MPEIKEMIRDSEPGTSDNLILDNIGLDGLDLTSLERYRNSLREYNYWHPWLKMKEEEFMEAIGAAGRGADGKLHPTGAGLLMFGKEHRITDIFPEYFLDYRERSYSERWSHRLHSQSGEWSGDVFDFFTLVAERLSVSVPSPFKLEGLVRKGESDAFIAAREAVINALIHSDYSAGGGVVIEIGRNIVTVSNPGTFHITLSDAVKGGVSDPRNGRIMKMFTLIGLAEHAGSGLHAMIESERSGAIKGVRIEESYAPPRVTIVLDLSPEMRGAGRTASKVMDALTADNMATTAKLAEKTGLSEKTVSRAISELKMARKIVRAGSRRNGYWVVK